MVGDLPPDFLRIPVAAQTPQQQVSSDEMTARMMQAQQMGYAGGVQGMPTNVTGRISISLAQVIV